MEQAGILNSMIYAFKKRNLGYFALCMKFWYFSQCNWYGIKQEQEELRVFLDVFNVFDGV